MIVLSDMFAVLFWTCTGLNLLLYEPAAAEARVCESMGNY